MAKMAALVILCLGTIFSVTSSLDNVNYSMEEELPLGTVIGDIRTDAALAEEFLPADYQRLMFSILTPAEGDVNSQDYFQVDESTGVLSVKNPLDRDSDEICAFQRDCVITFDVAVGPEDIFRVITVEIQVEDFNDNSPVFGLSEIKLNITELATPGTSYQLPVVSDRDGDMFGVKTMSVSPDSGQFDIRWMRGSSGKVHPRLELLRSLDREQVMTFDLTITASDGGSSARTAILLVHVDVIDANDNIPEFHQDGYDVYVSEAASPGTSLTQIQATDRDQGSNGAVLYRLALTTEEQYGTLFSIDEQTGVLTLEGSLDREALDVYYLSVVAVDQGEDGREASSTVTIYVDDQNDNAPIIRISTFTESGLAQVPENSAIGTFVAFLSVTDLDWGRNADATCTLSSGDFRLESIQMNKYKIVTAVTMNRERQQSYELDVDCHDNGIPQRSSSALVTISVDDVNDNAPVFTYDDVTIHVQENSRPGTVIGDVLATDADYNDNGRISYNTMDSYSVHVIVDEETGVISTISSLDRETLDTFTIYIIASDHGTPALSATATVTIIVDDVNDMVPTFTEASYTYVVTENDNARRELARLTAIDRDHAPHNIIRYSLRGPNAYFLEIDPENGTLYAVKPLDRELMPSISVQAAATDIDNPAFIGLANVTIFVSDVNDHAPRIIFPSLSNHTIEISNLLHVDDTVGWLTATDGDTGQNAVLEYFLTFPRSHGEDILSIDLRTGLLTVLIDLFDVDHDVIHCVGVVKDAGIPSLVASVNFTVVINSTLAALPAGADSSNVNITIVIVVVATTVVVVTVLIAAIILVFRRLKKGREQKPRYTVEKMGTMVGKNGQLDIEKSQYGSSNGKVYHKEADVGSLGSGEGSVTDSGRGASEEGEHGRHNDSSDGKIAAVFPGADDSIVTGHTDISNSFDHTSSIQRRPSKNKNVTFEEEVTIAEISNSEQYRFSTPREDGERYDGPYDGHYDCRERYDGPHDGHYDCRERYDSCPAISYPPHESWSPDGSTEYSSTVAHSVPRRTVRNVKAKDRSKRLDSLAALQQGAGHLAESDPEVQSLGSAQYDFNDSSSLLKYKLHGADDSTSEIASAASTTSGSYTIEADDMMNYNCSNA